MDFNITELKKLVGKFKFEAKPPALHLFCPPSLVDDLEEYWSKDKSMDVKVHSWPKTDSFHFDYEEDKIYVIPAKELEKPIKLVFPECKEIVGQYLGLESSDKND